MVTMEAAAAYFRIVRLNMRDVSIIKSFWKHWLLQLKIHESVPC